MARSNLVRRTATWLALAIVLLIFVWIGDLVVSKAKGQGHNHPAADAPLHEKFYSTWMRPDFPMRSCCNKQDCYPAEVRLQDGQWSFLRREDQKWIVVPPEKIETERGSPDGKSHVCAPKPPKGYDSGTVFCFVLGSGI